MIKNKISYILVVIISIIYSCNSSFKSEGDTKTEEKKIKKYQITSENINEGNEQFVYISKKYNDSIRVYFPHGGTISNVTLYSDSSLTKKEYKSISYEMMDEQNYITFSKSDIGRYYVSYGSCHWGNDFWLTIKNIN